MNIVNLLLVTLLHDSRVSDSLNDQSKQLMEWRKPCVYQNNIYQINFIAKC